MAFVCLTPTASERNLGFRMSGSSGGGSPKGSPLSPLSPGLRSTGASVMNMSRSVTPSGRGPRDQRNQLEISHYETMKERADRFAQIVGDGDPRHVRTTVGSAIYRPGQKAENVYGCSITAGSRVAQDIQSSRLGHSQSVGFLPGAKVGEVGHDGLLAAAGNRRLLAGAGQGNQILYSPTSGLIG